jgi:type IV secretion system protein VirB5
MVTRVHCLVARSNVVMSHPVARRLALLASVSSAIVMAAPARADMPVIDISALRQMWQQVQQGLQEIQLLQSQLQQVTAVYNAISHITDLSSALSALGMLGIQNPLPVNVSSVQSLLRGNGSTSGMLSNIGSLFNMNYSDSHIYDPTNSSYENTLMSRRANSIAGINGLAGQLYQSMADRLSAMRTLESRLSSASDIKDVATIQGEIDSQRAYIAAQSAQAQSLAMMQVSYAQDQQQQREEQRQKDIDEVLSADPDRQ